MAALRLAIPPADPAIDSGRWFDDSNHVRLKGGHATQTADMPRGTWTCDLKDGCAIQRTDRLTRPDRGIERTILADWKWKHA